MYRHHFGLHSLPFSGSPNPAFYVDLPAHHEAMNLILFCLRSGEGFVKIVGEVGTGKSLLCRTLLGRLDDDFVSAYLPNPSLPPFEMLMALALELGVPLPPRPGAQRLLQYLRDELIAIRRAGQHAALIIDEAQSMSDDSLEAIRLLSNFELESGKLLQLVLFAQPELDLPLMSPRLRPLRQRIAFSHRLESMDREVFEGYVSRRLAAAGYARGRLFTPFAIGSIHRASRGIPRLANTLCHKALLCAWADGELRVRLAHARRAALDSECLAGWRRLPFGRGRTRSLPGAQTARVESAALGSERFTGGCE